MVKKKNKDYNIPLRLIRPIIHIHTNANHDIIANSIVSV